MTRISGNNLAREAILAAQRRVDTDGLSRARKAVDEAFSRVQNAVDQQLGGQAGGIGGGEFGSSATGRADTGNTIASGPNGLVDAVRSLDSEVRAADPEVLAKQLVTGQVKDIHEVVAIVKQAEVSQRFALEVRNKLIDAYREVMRMGV